MTAESRLMGRQILVTATYVRQRSFCDQECVLFFNVLFNKMMKVMKYVRMKQNYYDKDRVSQKILASSIQLSN